MFKHVKDSLDGSSQNQKEWGGEIVWLKVILKQWPWVFTYTIVDYGVYTSFGYHTFLQPIFKNFLAIKDIIKPFLHAKFQTD